MKQKTLYTAIGRLERETNGCGRSCPVIRLGGQPCMVDMQELVVWTALNWRISKWEIFLFSAIGWPHLWAVLSAGPGTPV